MLADARAEMKEVLQRVVKQVQTGQSRVSDWQQQQHQAWHYNKVVRPQQEQQRRQEQARWQQERVRQKEADKNAKLLGVILVLSVVLILILYFRIRSWLYPKQRGY
jgi:hypothetical protein